MTDRRLTTSTGRLVRLGFEDIEGAARSLVRLGESAEVLTALVGTTADPDQALAYLADLADRVEDRTAFLRALVDDEGTAMRLLAVVGPSAALGDHLLRHPEHWRELTDPTLGSTRGSRWASGGAATGPTSTGTVRRRRQASSSTSGAT